MRRLREIYMFLAYMTFNCVLAFVILNVILGAVFFVKDRGAAVRTDPRVRANREIFSDYDAYTRLSRNDASTLLDEQEAMDTIGLRYQPWVQFGNPTVSGRFLNTDERGFRATRAPAPRPGNPMKLYVFGGSTTFGYGVADDDTIPSYLQTILEAKHPTVPIKVKNFGQAFHYSSQEQLAFLVMLKRGDIPDWAVFIDGGNDTGQLALGHDEPIFTPAVKRMWAERTTGRSLVADLPVGRLIRIIARRTGRAVEADRHSLIYSDSEIEETERKKIVAYVVSSYLANVRITRATCREFGVQCLFVWQPHPAYKYRRELHKKFPFEGSVPSYFERVYAQLENHDDPDFLFLGSLLEGRTQKSYVDQVHYNETINEVIAERIAQRLRSERRQVAPAGARR